MRRVHIWAVGVRHEGARPSGYSRAGLRSLGSGGRAVLYRGSGIEFVLEDDRRRLTIDPRAVRLALGAGRRSAGSTVLHGPQPLLGKVARKPLVAHGERQVKRRGDVLRPGFGELGLRPVFAR